jgi:hypothetical protein
VDALFAGVAASNVNNAACAPKAKERPAAVSARRIDLLSELCSRCMAASFVWWWKPREGIRRTPRWSRTPVELRFSLFAVACCVCSPRVEDQPGRLVRCLRLPCARARSLVRC